jgi:hypothetical protein
MSYALKLQETHRLAYAGNVMMAAQQMTNRLQGAVTEIPGSGEAIKASDIFGRVEALEGEPRSRRNPENPIRAEARWLVLRPEIESGEYIDKEDQLASIMDPMSDLVRAHTAAVIRGWQNRVMGVEKTDAGLLIGEGGILGSARTGKTPGAPAALPSGQFIPVNATGLTLDKLRLAVLKLQEADFGIEDDDPLYAAITPKQKDDLLAIAAATNQSLNSFAVEQLQSGKPTMLMGINWILTNQVPKKAAGGPRAVPVWSKRNIVVGVWQPIKGDAWNVPSMKNKPYVYVSAMIDAVRLQDKGVVVIECQE